MSSLHFGVHRAPLGSLLQLIWYCMQSDLFGRHLSTNVCVCVCVLLPSYQLFACCTRALFSIILVGQGGTMQEDNVIYWLDHYTI